MTMRMLAPIVVAMTCSLTTLASAENLRLGTDGAYPPFSQTDTSGALSGFDIDFANLVCERMEVTCEFVIQPWDGIIPALNAGQFDAIIASMTITDERREAVDFSIPYYVPNVAIAFKAGEELSFSPESLAGKRIGVQSATIYANYVKDVLGDTVTVREYTDEVQRDQDLLLGRIDVALGSGLAMAEGLMKLDSAGDIEVAYLDQPDPKWFGYGNGAAVRKGEDDLRERINTAIREIYDSGDFTALSAKYFGEADISADYLW